MDGYRYEEVRYYPYETMPDGTEVYCSAQREDGAAYVLFRRENSVACSVIPGYWWLGRGDADEQRLQCYESYLTKNVRALCHFALDRFIDSSEDLTLTLPSEQAEELLHAAAALGDSPPRYIVRLLRWFVETNSQEKDRKNAGRGVSCQN